MWGDGSKPYQQSQASLLIGCVYISGIWIGWGCHRAQNRAPTGTFEQGRFPPIGKSMSALRMMGEGMGCGARLFAAASH